MGIPDLTACCSSCASAPDPTLATYSTLDKADLERRLNAIRDASSRTLISAQREDEGVRLLFDGRATAEITALLDAERQCCSFVNSKGRTTAEGFEVTLSAKPEDRTTAEALFAAFVGVEHAA